MLNGGQTTAVALALASVAPVTGCRRQNSSPKPKVQAGASAESVRKVMLSGMVVELAKGVLAWGVEAGLVWSRPACSGLRVSAPSVVPRTIRLDAMRVQQRRAIALTMSTKNRRGLLP